MTLSLAPPEQLEGAWSGGLARQPWRGKLGDGEELTIEWGYDGDLLFDYGGGARFRLDADREALECAPAVVSGLDWQRVLLSRILPDVALARGYEALHAAAVETAAGTVAIAAPSGTGKSTLAAELIRRGGALLADDVVVLEAGEEEVRAHPGGPHMNFAEGDARAEELGAVLGTLAGEHWLAVDRLAAGARSLAAVVLLERAPGRSLEVELLDPNPLTLAPFMLGLPDEEADRAASRFALYSDLVGSTRLLRLGAAPEQSPEQLAEALEGALASGVAQRIGRAP